MSTVLLGLGSNIFPKAKSLSIALAKLSELVDVYFVSGVYKTKSLLLDNQPDYFNIVIKGKTSLEPSELLDLCKSIETTMQRNTVYKWGPRNIDIDIIDFDKKIFETIDLHLPHREFPYRNFVLLPLLEVDPAYVHPGSHIGVEKMYELLDNHSNIYRLGELKWQL